MSENDLKTRYALAKQALADKDFDTAIDLLRRILLEDENYRDASRLLAQVVEHRRRHWYNNPRLWGLGIIIIVIGLLIWLVPKLSLPALIATRPTATITTSPTVALTPTRTPLPARTPPPSATPVPLAWKRISVGLEFKRDSITAIVVDPKDPDVIYVGSQNAGVYKSIDGGISWKPIQNGLGAGRIDDLDIDLKDPQILYAAVADGGIFKTTDGGESWKQLWAGEFYSTHNVAVAPWDSRVLFQWGGSGNYRSDDGGETFSPIAEGCLAESYFVISQSQPGTLYLSNLLDPFGDSTEGCTGGIYRSTDRGMTWELIGLEGYYQVGGTWGAFAVGGLDDQYLYIDANSKSSTSGEGSALYASSDGGATWYIAKDWCMSIQVNPLDGREVYCFVEYFEYPDVSYDAGMTWERLKPLETSSFTSFNLYRSGNTVLVGGDGLFVSFDNGRNWQELSNGLGAQRLELKINPSEVGLRFVQEGNCIADQNRTLYGSPDGGFLWKAVDAFGCDLAFDADGLTLYRTGSRSMDGGMTWGGWDDWNPGWSRGALAHRTQSGKIFIYGGNPSLYRSSDYGDTWQEILGDIELRGDYTRLFTDNEGAAMYLTISGRRMYYSIDEGSTWTSCTDVNSAESDQILAIDPRNNRHLYIATKGNGIMVSLDSCQSWEESNTGLGSWFVNTIAIDPNNPDTLYAGTDGGAYISFDGGQRWHQINDGLLGALVIYSIVVDKDSNVYSATPYGIFRLEGK